METRHSGYTNWDVNFHQESYVETFTSVPYNMNRENIVYLTSESENVIGSSLDPSKVYVIGGLVDHNHHKGICHKMAIENKVSHARLPIDEYVDMKARKVLCIDHVFQILSKVASEGQSWKEAFLSTLPARKGAIGLDDDEADGGGEKENDSEENDKGGESEKERI